MALPGRHQIERLALRAKPPQGPARQGAADVVREHGSGAHRVDARLRQIARREGNGVAGGEHVVASHHPQHVVDLEEAALVERQSGFCQPPRRRGLRGPQDLVDLDRRVTVEQQPSGLDPGDRRAAEHHDAAGGENGVEAGAECRRKLGRISTTSDMRTNDSALASNPACVTSRRKRCSTDSRSSTPPAPAPTRAKRVRPLCASTRALSASNRPRNPSIGLTGMACSAAPGTSPVLGVEPMLSESHRRRVADAGRSRRPAMSSATTSS